jgi:hypothetical protein
MNKAEREELIRNPHFNALPRSKPRTVTIFRIRTEITPYKIRERERERERGRGREGERESERGREAMQRFYNVVGVPVLSNDC